MPQYKPNVPLGQYFPSLPPSDVGPSEVNPSSFSSEEDDKGPSQPPPVSIMRTELTPLSAFLISELERVVAGMRRIPVPQSSKRRTKPPKQVLGLVCKRLWDAEMQARGVHKSMPDPKDKGKRKMD